MTERDESLPRISHSQLGVWDRCKFSWKLNYIDEWTSKDSKPALDLGVFIHHLCAELYKRIQAGENNLNRLIEAMQEDCKIALSESSNYDDIQRIQKAGWLLTHYINHVVPTEDSGHKILAVEQEMFVTLTSPNGLVYQLQVIIDLLTEKQGRVWLWDHKSSAGRFWTPLEAQMDSQMPTYAAALREANKIDVFGIIVNQFNTYDYKKPAEQGPEKLFRREKTHRTHVELDSILHEIGLAIEEMVEAKTTPEYVFRRSLKKDCSSCHFQEPCLMGLKGIDPVPILHANFKKKEKRVTQESQEIDIRI